MSLKKLFERAAVVFNVQGKPTYTVIYEEPEQANGDLLPVRLGAKLDALIAASGGGGSGGSSLADVISKPSLYQFNLVAASGNTTFQPGFGGEGNLPAFTLHAVEFYSRSDSPYFVRFGNNNALSTSYVPENTGEGASDTNGNANELVPSRGFLQVDLRGTNFTHFSWARDDTAGGNLYVRVWGVEV